MSLLRTLKSKYKGAEIIPFSVASDGSITNNQIACAKTATGKYTLTPKWAWAEKPFVVVQSISGASAIRMAQVTASGNTNTSTDIEIRTRSSGALADGAFNGFMIGSRSQSPRYYPGWTEFPAKVGAFRNRFSYFEYNGTTQSGGTGDTVATLSNPSTGNYTLTFATPSVQTPVILAMSDDDTDSVDINAVGVGSCTIKVRNSGGSAHNGTLHVFVMTSHAGDGWHTGVVSAKINDLGAHILPFEISASAIVRGDEYFTFTDNGVGDYTLTAKYSQLKPGYFFATQINDDTTDLNIGNARSIATASAVSGSINITAKADTPIMGFAIGFSKAALIS